MNSLPVSQTSPAEPITETPVEPKDRTEILPPYVVILHNDDHNEMLHVVRALLKSVPKLSRARATAIMLEAHFHGQAVVTTCPLELAELYRDRLQSFGLTATIRKAR
ncbi:MAG TPA: ATP-dependent Clp protease adaptor ClpS [Dehalococcoidia bacterium]|nr:ATP-dependent Clp protease adaptor ClpS [Dehalococcoidia bacterium]